MANITGPDVSFWQDDNNTAKQIDFQKMKDAGAEFVIIRAGQNTWVDGDFEHNWHKAKEAGIPRGSYWFYDSRSSPRVQADLWSNAIGTDYPECGIWADFEESYNGPYSNEKYFREFMELLQANFPPLVELGAYTGYYYWIERVKLREYWHQYPLWIANYGVTKPNIPPPWSADEWTFWQYTDKGDGLKYGAESKNIDMNFYNGDLTAFNKQFGITSPEPPTQPPAHRRVVIEGVFTITEE
jgi:lysozyme